MAFANQLSLRCETNNRLRLADADAVLHSGQGVKGNHMRSFPAFMRHLAETSGQPVVAMNHIVIDRVPVPKSFQLLEKYRHLSIKCC